MPKVVSDVEILRTYLSGVIDRAEHHAGNVDQVALGLVGAILWQKDDEPIEVFERQGEMKNVLWVRIRGKRYAFTYNHLTESIEMRCGSTQGHLVESFTNATTLNHIKTVFETL